MRICIALFTLIAAVEAAASGPWIWGQSQCAACSIQIVPLQRELTTKPVQEFIKALEEEKPALQRIYKIDGQTYNLLAQMSIGILGRESLFFTSKLYHVKEDAPWLVDAVKKAEGKNSLNSRGPTQIKKVPDLIAVNYGVTPQTLWQPRHAAVATMGFLIEALSDLKEMKRRAGHRLDFINETTYVESLGYVYIGLTKKLLSGTAHPEVNNYIIAMKKYMSWVQIFELDSDYDNKLSGVGGANNSL